MAISFSGQAPVAVEFSGTTGRAEFSSRQSRAVDASDTGDVRRAVKARPGDDDEFGTVLAGLLMVSGNLSQPNPAVEKTETTTISAADESVAAPLSPLIGAGQAVTAAGTGEQQSAGTSLYSPGDPQNSAGSAEESSGLAGAEGFDSEPQTIGLATEASRNSTVPEILEQTSSILPSFLPPQVSQVPARADEMGGPEYGPDYASLNPQGPETEVPSIQSSVSPAIDSESFAAPESLSQDALDALDRIGELTGEKTPEDATPAVSGHLPSISALNNKPTTIVTGSELTASPGSAAALTVPTLPLSAVTQFGLSKSPLSIAMSASKTSDQTAELAETTQQETPDSDAESEQQLISTTSEFGSALGAEESRLLSVADAPAAETVLNTTIAARQESLARGLQSNDPEINAGSGPVGPASVPAESRSADGGKPGPVAAGAEKTPGEAVQWYVANTFSEVATTLSGDVGHTLSGQVSQAVLHHIEHSGVRSNDSLTVRLDPPELGEMRIEISKTVDGLAVRVTALEAITMDMLLARGQEIESQLRGQQLDLKSLEFVRSDLSQNGFSQGHGQGQQQSNTSGRAANQLNQIRSGARNAGPAITSVPRNTASDSPYGLSFRA